jgi:prepilin-type processing-associated H-X9-DG protein
MQIGRIKSTSVPKVIPCPSATVDLNYAYSDGVYKPGYNITGISRPLRQSKARAPSRTALVMDSNHMYYANYNSVYNNELSNRHLSRLNVLFLDGHIDSKRLIDIPDNHVKSGVCYSRFWDADSPAWGTYSGIDVWP